jgi:hypothetical protein
MTTLRRPGSCRTPAHSFRARPGAGPGDAHPSWCEQYETTPGRSHVRQLGDLEVGQVVLTVGLRQVGQQSAFVALGVHAAESSITHRLTREQAGHLRDLLIAGVEALGLDP